jgi:perosamine synthetase
LNITSLRVGKTAEAGEAAVLEAVDRLEDFYRRRLGCHGTVLLHAPSFGQVDRDYLLDCIDSGWVSTAGAYVPRFESCLREFCGTGHAIATVNGTAALHIALLALGVRQGNLVICPPLTFVATANAIAYCGAEPLFCDVEQSTLGLGPDAVARFLRSQCRRTGGGCIHVASGRTVCAMLPVHVFGHPVQMDELLALGLEWGIPVVEDATEALGSTYKGRACGSLGLVGIFSFNGNKICTTGGGGMVVTDDGGLGAKIRHLATTARVSDGWEFVHDAVGYNYRLPNLNAALGCAQMARVTAHIENKRRLRTIYADLLAGLDGLDVFHEPLQARSNYWLNAVLCADRRQRDLLLEASNHRDIQARPCWRLMPDLPPFANAIRADDLAVARDLADRIVNIPSSPELGEAATS